MTPHDLIPELNLKSALSLLNSVVERIKATKPGSAVDVEVAALETASKALAAAVAGAQ